MILFSTRIKLAQANKKAYRVQWPEFTVQTVTVPAATEDFAFKQAAQAACNRWAPHCEGSVSIVEPLAGF